MLLEVGWEVQCAVQHQAGRCWPHQAIERKVELLRISELWLE